MGEVRQAFRRRAGHLALALSLAAAPAGAEVLVFAAASTRAPLEAAVAASGIDAVVSYGASGTIARQIEQGAPADVFVSANPRWMAHLVEGGHVVEDDVANLASNRLVLIAPEDAAAQPLDPAALGARLDGRFLAMADPEVAPVGQYGRDALTALGLWDAAAPSLLPTRNTLATVATVARGEAALGLVYRSDAEGAAGVSVAATLPGDAHPPILYLVAPVGQGNAPDAAAALIAFLTGPEGQSAFAAAGFAPAEAGP